MIKNRIKNYLGRNLNKKRDNDKIDAKRRSSVMSKIRSTGTKFEKSFFEILDKATDIPYETNVKSLRGKPDIVFSEHGICVFLDSDFWHGWQFPRWTHLLKNDFWIGKIEKNRARDKRNTAYLRKHGWTVIRIWEHNINKDAEAEIDRILKALKQNTK